MSGCKVWTGLHPSGVEEEAHLLAIALLLMLLNENHTVQYNIKGPTVSIQRKSKLYV